MTKSKCCFFWSVHSKTTRQERVYTVFVYIGNVIGKFDFKTVSLGWRFSWLGLCTWKLQLQWGKIFRLATCSWRVKILLPSPYFGSDGTIAYFNPLPTFKLYPYYWLHFLSYSFVSTHEMKKSSYLFSKPQIAGKFVIWGLKERDIFFCPQYW